MAVYGNPHEKERFFKSIGMSKRELSDALPDYDFYLQGYDRFHEESLSKKIVFAFGDAVYRYKSKGLLVTPHHTIEKRENFAFDGAVEYDNKFSDIYDYAIVKIFDEKGLHIGLVDTLGNLHLTDFYHNSKPFPVDFAEFVKKYRYSHEGVIEDKFLRIIKAINPYKIKEIKVEFDKERYIKEVMDSFRAEIKNMLAKERIIINDLKEAFDYEIKNLRRNIEAERQNGFIEGLKSAFKLKKDWKIEGEWLKYTKRIYANRVKCYGRLYRLDDDKKFYVSGLRIYIAPRIFNDYVKCSRAYHPNCRGQSVCIGDLDGKPISEVIEKVVDLLKTCNLESAYDVEATHELREAVDESMLEEEGVVWDVE